ncbi:MAG: hypothetical protein GXP47_11075 [Acidobacteria bacterium]|nr:hypothetical protein [Acidobacteriota bacterium]
MGWRDCFVHRLSFDLLDLALHVVDLPVEDGDVLLGGAGQGRKHEEKYPQLAHGGLLSGR